MAAVLRGSILTPMPTSRGRLPSSVVAAIDESSYLGIRAGARSDHRFIAVWPIVVNGRVFARSWTLEPDGWYHAFLADPLGTIQRVPRRHDPAS